MATRCCNHHISCPGQGNLDFDTPIANLSAEAPDIDFYIGLNWGWDRMQPPVGRWFTKNSCLGVCESAISQADADACAARNQLLCVGACTDCPPPPPPDSGPPLDTINLPMTIFRNNPEGCSSTCPDGLTFTYVTPPGKYAAPSQLLADRMAASEACHFAVSARICLSDLSPDFTCTDRSYSAAIRATGGTAPINFSTVSGGLPPGMNFSQAADRRTLLISGSCSTPGDYTFQLRAEDAAGHFMQKTFTLHVLGVTNAGTLPNGSIGTPYTYQFVAAGGVPPYTFQDPGGSSGVWPDGLVVRSFGLVQGTPTTNGNYTFGINVVDSQGHGCTAICHMLVGTCNDAMSSTGFCPGFPSVTFHADIPVNTYCENTKGQANARASADLVNQIRIGLAAQGCLCPGPTVDLGAGTIGTVHVTCLTSFAWNLNSPAIVFLNPGDTFDPFAAFHLFNGFDIPHGTPSILTPTSYVGPPIYMFYP